MPSAQNDSALHGQRLSRVELRSRVRATAALVLPALIGLTVAIRGPEVGADYFAVVSQLIATLFIAIVVEAVTAGRVWDTRIQAMVTLWLAFLSWVGLFACIRALMEPSSPLLVGLAAAGVAAASTLVALGLHGRIASVALDSTRGQSVAAATAFMLITVPALVLVWP